MPLKFRVGDVVSLEGKVVGTHAGVAYVVQVTEGHHGGEASLMMKEGQLKLVAPAPLQAGDIVIHNGNEAQTYTVLATNGPQAWVQGNGDRQHSTVLIANLVVVDRT